MSPTLEGQHQIDRLRDAGDHDGGPTRESGSVHQLDHLRDALLGGRRVRPGVRQHPDRHYRHRSHGETSHGVGDDQVRSTVLHRGPTVNGSAQIDLRPREV